jgi:lipopolysaccharide transport system ATP-binding protein
MSAVVKFESVSKKYFLGQGQESFRELITRSMKGLFKQSTPAQQDHLMALEDVSFEINQGQVLGLIGTNGAGKTTTLKLLSRVTKPTTGQIHVQGRVSALIELGAGFHPDFTGRENIYLNGAILGLSRQEIHKKFDSIVAFAELEQFIDTPVKRYSSGMYARLGFAVAAHSDPDLLLVDEVLAVGDINFQKKCYDFIQNFVNSGNTAIFVSHNMYVFEQLCNQVLWLDHGRIKMSGEPLQVLAAYLDYMDQRALAAESNTIKESQGEALRVTDVCLTDSEGKKCDTFVTGEDIVIEMRYCAEDPISSPYFCFGVGVQGGSPLFLASMLIDGKAPLSIQGEGVLRCRLKDTPLMPKVYDVWGEIWGEDRTRTLVQWQKLGMFRFIDSKNGGTQHLEKGAMRHLRADAPIKVPYEWEY